ncbi:DNA mismatch repair endonuclease MutH [Glaciecola siphonariae]|uniref:DNA mismatch repair protein MutH n=1 Tax=Glaciecola siphonariae TaxID=521012 RepID=A0ABV9LZS8_9ALTE
MIVINLSSPTSVEALLERARDIAGLSFGELAGQLNVAIPENFKRQKGWTGQLIERALGASAGSKPIQDFPQLGIELKTLPLSYANTPLETTYVCYAPLTDIAGISWQTSNVRNKIRQVLWIPVQGEREIPVSERIIGHGFLWQPTERQDALLQQDWEELMDLIALGKVESITARMGQYMQLRPKAANGRALTDAIGHDGSLIKTRPRGFYLRKEFTQLVLNSVFGQ